MARRWVVVVVALALLAPGVAALAQGKIELYDFEDGVIPKGWTLTKSRGNKPPYEPVAELETNAGNTVLELGKNALLTMGDEKVTNFSVEAVVRREYDGSGAHVGFQFRNGYRVYIRKPGRIELTGPNKAKGRGFKRNMVTHKPLAFRIVVVGPAVRFFINGKYEGQFDGLEVTPGPVALYQSDTRHNVYFDNVKFNTAVRPAQFLACEPITAADHALVFDPDGDVDLKFKVTNHAPVAQEAELGIDLATFDEKPVFNTTSAPAMLKPGESKTMAVSMGRLPEGFYRLKFLPTGKVVPVAVHKRGTVTEDQITMPKIMTGIYWYYLSRDLPPVWRSTYMHAAFNDLRRHNFNTIICSIGEPDEFINLAGTYGIRCFVRGQGRKGNVALPNAVGGFIGDEPHKGQEKSYIQRYTNAMEKYPDKIWTTCMIGDGGVEHSEPWWDTWTKLKEPNRVTRMFRWYGIKRSTIGVKRRYGGQPPLEEILRDMTKDPSPYYFIMPSFGSEGVRSYYGNPVPAQIRAMMHLAAAFECDGLFFWTYQTPFPGSIGFVDPPTLLPNDGKWAAAGEVAGKVLKNADLLSECKWSGRYSFVEGPPTLEAFILKRQDDPAQYFYVINKDTTQSVNGRLFSLTPGHTLTNLFDNEPMPITKGRVKLIQPGQVFEGPLAHVSLMPGDGVLLKYAPPADAAAVAAKTMPRVTYPKAVADAPETQIIWLDTLKPIEMPVPGWIPMAKFKGKVWFPDYHTKDLPLFSGPEDQGQVYKHSLWAHAETVIKYDIPAGATTFASAIGFGSKNKKSSAIFRVLVDGKEVYNSGVMTINTPVKPVVIDLKGGKRLDLITEEAGDGLYGDYTWWGEARLIKK